MKTLMVKCAILMLKKCLIMLISMVNNILSSSPNLMKILMFTRETMIDPFFNTLMACEEKIINETQLSFKVSHSNGRAFNIIIMVL
jgi:hypothetical protein